MKRYMILVGLAALVVILLAYPLMTADAGVGASKSPDAKSTYPRPLYLVGPVTGVYTQWASADTYIWEDHPFTNYGGQDHLQVDDNIHALLQWNLEGMPQRAMVDSAEFKLRLEAATGAPNIALNVHSLSSAWKENEATWVSSTATDPWNTWGGDYGYRFSWQTVSNTPYTYSWRLTDLVAEWHSGRTENHGVLLRHEWSQTATFSRTFASREHAGFNPELIVEYTLGPLELYTRTPVIRGVPSPDWYRFQPGNDWNAVAIRPASADYELYLYDSDSYMNELAHSTEEAHRVDYVLVDGHRAPHQAYYPKVTQYSGQENYEIEYSPSAGALSVGLNGPFTMTSANLIQVRDIDLQAGVSYYFSLVPISGDADLDFRLHGSSADPRSWYQGRYAQVASGGRAPGGGTEYMSYTPPAAGDYAVVVDSKGALSPASYWIYIDTTPPIGSFQINDGSCCANSVDVTLTVTATDPDTGLREMRFANNAPPKALLLRDSVDESVETLRKVLDYNGIAHEEFPSSIIPSLTFSRYQLIIIPSTRGDPLCERYNSQLTKFASFVQQGGRLELHAAVSTSDPRDTCHLLLPGGGASFEDIQHYNYIVSPTHPLLAGVLKLVDGDNLFSGNQASYSSFANVPANASVLATAGDAPGGAPTVVEYPFGEGRVVAFGQNLEQAWEYGERAGLLLDNAIPYVAGYTRMPWSLRPSWVVSPSGDFATVYGQFRDNAGAWSPVYSDSITISSTPDITAPTSTCTAPVSVTTGTIPVTCTATDSHSGVQSIELWGKYDSGGWNSTPPPKPCSAGSPTCTQTFIFSPTQGSGAYYFDARSADWAGNREITPTGTGDISTTYGGPQTVTHTYFPLVIKPLQAPTLKTIENSDHDGNYTVQWDPVEGATSYILEEYRKPGCFDAFRHSYPAPFTSYTFTTRGSARYEYKVAALRGQEVGEQSSEQTVDVLQEQEDHQDVIDLTDSITNGPIVSGLTYSGARQGEDFRDFFFMDLCQSHHINIFLMDAASDAKIYLFRKVDFSGHGTPGWIAESASCDVGHCLHFPNAPAEQYVIMVRLGSTSSDVRYRLRAEFQ